MEVLFVCTGNTCRSPMAEACFNAAAVRAGRKDLAAKSAGICACGGEPASPEAQKAVSGIGLDLSGFKSRRLTREMVRCADLIVCMGMRHAEAVVGLVPGAAAKVRLLAPDGGDIADPFGGGPEIYRQCLRQIETAVAVLVDNF